MFRPFVKPRKVRERAIKGKARSERREQEMRNRQADIPVCHELISFIPRARIARLPGDDMRNPYGPRRGKAPKTKNPRHD